MERLGVRSKLIVVRGLMVSLMAWLVLGGFGGWLSPVTPALAQVAGPPVLEQPAPPPEEKKEEAPTTCGPVVSDTCIPISTGKFAMQVWTALSFYPNVFTQNWRPVDPGAKLHTFYMPVKFTYGPMKDMEVYVVIPFITNWATDVKARGPNGENSASYSGIGDMTAIVKYNFLPETDWRPAVTGVAGFASIPTGHAISPQPDFPGCGCRGHRGLNLHHRCQSVQMVEALAAV